MSLIRANSLALRAVRSSVRRSAQFTRRYATEHSHEEKKSSELPLLLASATAAGGAVYFLTKKGPVTKHKDEHKDDAGTEVQQQEAASSAEGSAPQPDPGAEKKVASGPPRGGSYGQPPSTVDSADSRKDPGGPSTISAKQEGWSNGPTDNPFMNEPGKSVKGEGEPETAKVKGTVSPQRPQS